PRCDEREQRDLAPVYVPTGEGRVLRVPARGVDSVVHPHVAAVDVAENTWCDERVIEHRIERAHVVQRTAPDLDPSEQPVPRTTRARTDRGEIQPRCFCIQVPARRVRTYIGDPYAHLDRPNLRRVER